MSKNIESRLGRLESAGRNDTPEFWMERDDGLMHNASGQTMTRAAFQATYPDAMRFQLDLGKTLAERE